MHGLLQIQLWALRSIFEACYAILPAYCLITNSHFLPKGNEPSIIIPALIFIIYNLYGLSEYIRANEPIIAWMNNQRMWRVNAMSAWLFGILSATIKLLGFSETAFEITKKGPKMTQILILEGSHLMILQFLCLELQFSY
uniref:Putative ovule protein n=1 Tax=Solanum chacoense TaxID=4108 RepID=A0A0V0H2J0_SOLCH